MLKKLSLIILCVVITGCMTHSISGTKAKSVSDLNPPRQFPIINFNIPRTKYYHIFSTSAVTSSFEASDLFTQVIPDFKRRGGRSIGGLYVETTITSQDSTNPFLAVLSLLTMGLMPMKEERDFTIKSVIYIDRKKVKTYHDIVKTTSYFAILFPTPLLLGRSEEEMKKLFAVRYTSNLLTKMHRDNIAFN